MFALSYTGLMIRWIDFKASINYSGIFFQHIRILFIHTNKVIRKGRIVNCFCIFSAYILKTVLSGLSVPFVFEEDKNI